MHGKPVNIIQCTKCGNNLFYKYNYFHTNNEPDYYSDKLSVSLCILSHPSTIHKYKHISSTD